MLPLTITKRVNLVNLKNSQNLYNKTMQKNSKYYSNSEIAKLLKSVSSAYEVLGENRFKVIAYSRAASAIEYLSSNVKDVWDDGKLEEVAGVGPSIAKHLDEFFRTGKVKHFQEIFMKVPPAMFELLDIPGIGAKTAFRLSLKLKLNPGSAKEQLKNAAKRGLIQKIDNFGQKTEKLILDNLNRAKTKRERMLLVEAEKIAGDFVNFLLEKKAGQNIDFLGSLRRQASTIGDIDIALATDKPKLAIDIFTKAPMVAKVINKGESSARIIDKTNHQIDLKTVSLSQYGSLLQHYTGSKLHNIKLREMAQKKNLSLSEYGIKLTNGEIRQFKTEQNFYKYLGLDWIPPELREDSGEIEAVQQGKLPRLVERDDLKGDLHIHSDFDIEPSHDLGLDSIEKLMVTAEEIGYEYIGIAEHNPSISKHTDKQIIDILKRKKEVIDKINYSRIKNVFIYVFNGLEIDIRPNGELALPQDAFESLDYAIASIHSSFIMDRETMTQRILRGLDHPKVKILGHPTGRKLNYREGVEADWDKIFGYCRKHNKWIEINSYPDRLDLPDYLVREAIKYGVKLIINSDGHSADQLYMIKYGVSVARRGWAGRENIVNCLGKNDISVLISDEK